jgi:uncharacterized iron-regulated membrane protein
LVKLRKFLFWLHLITGTVGGAIILIMSTTGVLLMCERQITAWADLHSLVSPSGATTARLPVETLLSKVRKAESSLPATLTMRSDPGAPVALGFGRQRTLFINVYNGEVLGEGSKGVREFFHLVTGWHRWLGAQDQKRASFRAVTGASNLAFLFLVLTGSYLWWPKEWTWRQVRNVTWFRRGLPSKARDFNWHNVIGFWSAIPLLVIVTSGVVISYPWASDLVYRVVGEEPPPQGRSGGATPAVNERGVREAEMSGKRGAEPQVEASRPRGESRERSSLEAPSSPTSFTASPVALTLDGLNELWARAEQQVSGWQSITMRLPVSAGLPVTFNIDEGNGGQPHKRSQLTLERTTGQVVRWEPFSSLTSGRQLRLLLRFAHTGEVGGIVGQTIAGGASLGTTFLVWTGLALAWRRLRAWQAQNKST